MSVGYYLFGCDISGERQWWLSGGVWTIANRSGKQMDLSEEWKSLWPISTVFSPPSLLYGGNGDLDLRQSSNESKHLGPLIFNPAPETLTLLFASPSLAPLLPPPFPSLTLSRFLQTSTDDSFLLPSTSSSVARTFDPQLCQSEAIPLADNRLQLLRCHPSSSSVLAFFPTGDNSDRVGFVVLSIEDRKLNVRGDEGKIFIAKSGFHHRILRLLVNPVAASFWNRGNYRDITVGYLLACTMYSVHWFRVKIGGLGTDLETPVLDILGSKLFKSCCVVHACWSPHISEESVVLLENGELFLFDLDSCSKTKNSHARFKGKRLRVVWDSSMNLEKGGWLSCGFSWHPRILVVAHFNAVFLVDLRPKECNVTCLLKLEAFTMDGVVEKDQFTAITKAGSDGFHFTVASNHWLLLCDVRKPLMPLLRWAHNLTNPSFMDVFTLSELRSHSKDDKYKRASDSGYCIILGSFWNCEFSIFCYGPPPRGSIASETSRICKSFYAWDLPSELSLSGRECHCGSCLVREEFSKDALPEWTDWREKKEIVLGFGILDKGLSSHLSEPDSLGGFTLIRLMSSGKLESQRYCASWDFVKLLKEMHGKSSLHFEDSLLYAAGDEEYKFAKRYKFLKLGYLNGYMKGNLTKVLVRKLGKNPVKNTCGKDSFSANFHQHMCQKLKTHGFSQSRTASVVSNVFKDVTLPTSIHEIGLRSIWVGLPVDMLQLAFSSYLEFLEVLLNKNKVSLEFLDIPHQTQLPPFLFHNPSCRGTKWSQKVQPGDGLVGPVLPLPVLFTLHKLHVDDEDDVLSADTELALKCNEATQVASKIGTSGSSFELQHHHAVPLADDKDEMCYGSQKVKSFSIHEPIAFFEKSNENMTPENSAYKDENFMTLVSKRPEKDVEVEMVGPELFNALCPLELKFDDCATKFGPQELISYKLLKKQFSNFLEGI